MEEWKEYKLGEVINILDYKRIPLSSAERKTREGGFPYYGAQGIIDYIDDYIFDGTYLLIAEDGENLKSKKQDIAQLAHGKYWVNNHAHIVESNGICDIRYLCYILNNIDLSGYITGSAQPKLNQANLSAISIILPPLNLQEQIADFISMFDNKIELNQRINDNLEQQAQALFKSWFVDFEPFKDRKFVNSELGMIPEGWRVGTLNELIISTLGGDWGKEDAIGNYVKKVSCIRGADIPEIRQGNRGNMPTRFILNKNFLNKALKAEDLVVEISGGSPTQSTGRICQISDTLLKKYDDVVICTNFCRAIKTKRPYSQFIYYLWEYLYKRGVMFLYENGTTGIKNLDINGLLEKEIIVIPDENTVHKYTGICNLFSQIVQSNGYESERLVRLRDTLLPKLMSGELEINDINN